MTRTRVTGLVLALAVGAVALTVALSQGAGANPGRASGPFAWLWAASPAPGWSVAFTPAGAALAYPAVMVVICTDLQAVTAAELRPDADRTVFIDVGTLMMNMMAEAHALGLGTCPATSFSRAGVEVVLGLPAHARPEAILLIGHPAAPRPPVRPWQSRPSRLLAELVYWERYGQAPPLPPG